MQVANKHMKRNSTSLLLKNWGNVNQISMRYNFTFIMMAMIFLKKEKEARRGGSRL